jgi:1,4-alpha-glucan branching enzyme
MGKMPGDEWQKFANMRLLLGYQYTQPGKKLLFMGGEIGQWREWDHDTSLDWHLLQWDLHRGLQRWSRDLNTLYRGEPALHELDCQQTGFEWVDCHDADSSTVSYLRRGRKPDEWVLVVCNFTPVVRDGYRVGVPASGRWDEVLNSDAPLYGGSGVGNLGGMDAEPEAWHGRSHSLVVTLPPLGMVVFRRRSESGGHDADPALSR